MSTSKQQIAVWDPFIRAFHWSLALAYLVAWASAEEWAGLHENVGYFILALLGLRVAWGLVGTRHARFSDFVHGPGAALTYLRSLVQGHPRDYLGHNPVGGWMVVGLIVVLLATASTGILANGDEGLWEELHEGLANVSLLLIVVHVTGVIASSVLHRENLIFSMFTGIKKRSPIDV
jgi:cytochrome b